MSSMKKQTKVLVLGLGNELLTDDGVGVHAVRLLQKKCSIPDISFIEVGTAILHVQHLLEKAEYVIAIDAVQAGDQPGAVCYFDIDQAQLNRPASLHDLGICGLLNMMPKSSRPEVTVLGIEPQIIDYGMELSPPVQASLAGVCKIVEKMIVQRLSHKAGCCVGS